VIQGRSFGPQDTPNSQPVAVVNQTFARSLFPNSSPLGKHFSLENNDDNGFEIIGVVKDARYESVKEQPLGAFFVFNGQNPTPDGYGDLIVRTRRRPELLINEIRQAIRIENPDLAISTVRTLSEQVDRSLNTEKLLADLAGFFGIVALLLACTGLYGVVAYSVARRRNEIGIRMALGARPAEVLGAVIRESLTLVALGLALGLPLALACGRLVSHQLYGVTATNPLFMSGSAAVLLATALVASLIPGRRAALLDPLIALREE
jgi:predicted permease